MKHLPDVKPLTWKGDLAARMVAGMDKFLRRATVERAGQRERYWKRDTKSWARHEKSVAPNRARLAKFLGVVDERVEAEMLLEESGSRGAIHYIGDMSQSQHTVRDARLMVLPGVTAEGLLLRPKGPMVASVVAMPDCDETPESVATGLGARLAQNGCQVFIPTLINRDCEWSGVAGAMTNEPHREFIYRAAYELGRHIIGLEIQKVLAAVDWFSKAGLPIGVIGYGEGGLIALNAAALDTRLDAAVVSGYFGPREGLFAEPIYRNVWRLLEEFGDAEVASLIAPRTLIVEHCPFPAVDGPPPVSEGRSGAAPGAITTPSAAAVRKELGRTEKLLGGLEPALSLVETEAPGSAAALEALLGALGAPSAGGHSERCWTVHASARLKRQFDEMVEWTQALMRESEYIRRDYWAQADATDVKSWVKTTKAYRKRFHEEVIGALPEPDMPPNPRARRVFATEAFTGYEVVLDVYPDVFAYGILLVPHDVQPGERRPVVVCQHGLEGRPQDVADPSVEGNCYYQFACRLAERGFVTFAPQNPYIGYDAFRVLQRMANPLGLSLFSFIIRQHQRLLGFLKTLPYVDGKRLAFYGLSYGGKTAMRVPAVLEDYCLSICSGDFNEWIWKNASTRAPFSYMRTGEYEMFEFDLGMTFNYAEMSYLICPRPFMVERGHWDGCSWDEWVAYEYAKTNYRYDLLGIGDRTEIEYFNGPHEIHAVGTSAFLEKHLRGQ
ncbi:dienelactone hydrolase family protein [bacterium]|nr:dienelactone hydrolase family protein [bacterium]